MMISKEMIHPLNKNVKYRFVWRTNWISPYESLWGIFEKFKYANNATVRDIYELFGTDYVKNLKSHTIGRLHRDCISLSGLDDDLIESMLRQSIIKKNALNIDQIFRILPWRPSSRYSYIRNELFFCPECIKIGFHSLFHQFKLLHECPYHQITLHSGCPCCNQSIPFELTDDFTQEPFRCKCGHSFIEINKRIPIFSIWKQISLKKLRTTEAISWINLNEEQVTLLKNIHIPINMDIEEFPEMIQHLLSVLKPAYRSKTKLKHNVVKSASCLNNLIGDTEKKIRKKSDFFRLMKLYEVLYGSSLQTFKGIAAHLRKNIFPKHKKCIQRISKSNLTDELVCPKAYAYVQWIKFVMGYESLRFITKITPYRKHPGKLEFASKQDDSYLTNLFRDLDMEQDITLESYAKVKWIFNRVMSHLIWNHYKNWVSISQEAAEQRLQYRRTPFSMRDIPFYILIIPKNNNEPVEFHWWDEINNSHKELESFL